jgi:membrane protein required for colicin V production
MTLVDWAIVIVLAVAALVGLLQGFVRSVCALGGLFVGLEVASWNYHHASTLLLPIVRSQAVADTIGFLFLAILVMAAIGTFGAIMAKIFHLLGLGWLDALAGAVFGTLQGALLVTMCILVTVAFFPKAHWLVESRLPRVFFRACSLSTRLSPAELAQRVRDGIAVLEEKAAPVWIHH